MILNGVGGVHVTGEAVLHDKGRDALLGEPLAQSPAFMTEAEFTVSSPGSNKDGRAGGFIRSGKERGDGGIVNVRDVKLFTIFGGLDFLSFVGPGFGSGSAIFPEWNGIGKFQRFGGEQTARESNCEEGWDTHHGYSSKRMREGSSYHVLKVG
jgi:hypothetical protein